MMTCNVTYISSMSVKDLVSNKTCRYGVFQFHKHGQYSHSTTHTHTHTHTHTQINKKHIGLTNVKHKLPVCQKNEIKSLTLWNVHYANSQTSNNVRREV